MARRHLITYELSVLIDASETTAEEVRERLEAALYKRFVDEEPPDGKILSFNGVTETADYPVPEN